MTRDASAVDERRSPAGGVPRGPDVAAVAAFAALALSVTITILIGLLGPSAMVPGLPGPSWHPPYALDARPGPHLVIALGLAAILLGGFGLAGALRSAWSPPARLLLVAGCAVAGLIALLPPSGSADHLNYAAYGRLVTLGQDPYAITPAALPGDPVVGAVEEWTGVTSVYGPVATAVQALASLVGGDSVRLTVFVMAAVNAAAFIGTALLLHRFAAGDERLRRRAALLWAANPLLLYHLAAGMHVDTLAIACMVAALAVRGAASGLLLGVGIGIKLNAGLVALGPAWELRRSPGRLAVVAGTATVTVLAVYAAAGPHVLDQVSAASRKVSLATPWHLVKVGLQDVFGSGAYTAWIQAGSLALMVCLAWLLLRTMPSGDAPAVAAAVVVAWLFAAPYALPWYDGLAFALLAMVSWPALEAFMVARITVLSLGYLPAREALRPEDLTWMKTLVREGVVPWTLLAVTAALAYWAVRSARRARRRTASAAPRP